MEENTLCIRICWTIDLTLDDIADCPEGVAIMIPDTRTKHRHDFVIFNGLFQENIGDIELTQNILRRI